MAEVEIRRLDGEDMIEVMHQLNTYAFRATPPVPDRETWAEPVRRRAGATYMAVFEDGRPMAGAVTTPQTHNVRGKLFKTAGLWGVATLPEGRRKGYSRQAIGRLMENDRQLGRVFSTLYPFRESFYEKMGYVGFPYTLVAKLSPHTLAQALKLDVEGEVQRLPIAEAYPIYRAYLEKIRAEIHGMTLFDFPDVETVRKNNPFWLAVARVNGAVEGLILYSLQGEEITKFNMRCWRFYYSTSRARYLLLGWVARHVDQADRAELRLAPYERPNTWLADLELKTELATWGPMGRILAVDGIGGMQAGQGAFTARMFDPMCPWNEGIWRFEGVDGALNVSAAAQAQCDLTIQGLSGLVYGVTDPQDLRYRGWGNPEPDVQQAMRSLFPSMSPHLHEEF